MSTGEETRYVILVIDRQALGRPIRLVSRRKGGGYTELLEVARAFETIEDAGRWLERARNADREAELEALRITARNAERLRSGRRLHLIDIL